MRHARTIGVVGGRELDSGAGIVRRLGVRHGCRSGRVSGGRDDGRDLEIHDAVRLDVAGHVDRPELERVGAECGHRDRGAVGLGAAVEYIVRDRHARAAVGCRERDRRASDVRCLRVRNGHRGSGVARSRGWADGCGTDTVTLRRTGDGVERIRLAVCNGELTGNAADRKELGVAVEDGDLIGAHGDDVVRGVSCDVRYQRCGYRDVAS